LDIPFVPEDLDVTGLDPSPAMLEQARLEAKNLPSIRLLRMNEDLALPAGIFVAVFLHLFLSVVELPRQALAEAGRCLILDKFSPVHRRPSGVRRLLNRVATRLGTDIEQAWEPWAEDLPVVRSGRERLCSGRVAGSSCRKWS
jgi:phosphatidylethanolamine/phosphatidyl-N-methylethanolamine N-methyltransferase